MTGLDNGLDLESFLLLMRADLGSWALLGLGTLVLGLVVWLSWGSRGSAEVFGPLGRGHAGLVLYGSTVPSVFRAVSSVSRDSARGQHIRQIRVSPVATKVELPTSNRVEAGAVAGTDSLANGRLTAAGPSLDLATEPIRLSDPSPIVMRSEASVNLEAPMTAPADFSTQPSLPITRAIPAGVLPPSPGEPEPRSRESTSSAGPPRLAAVGAAGGL